MAGAGAPARRRRPAARARVVAVGAPARLRRRPACSRPSAWLRRRPACSLCRAGREPGRATAPVTGSLCRARARVAQPRPRQGPNAEDQRQVARPCRDRGRGRPRPPLPDPRRRSAWQGRARLRRGAERPFRRPPVDGRASVPTLATGRVRVEGRPQRARAGAAPSAQGLVLGGAPAAGMAEPRQRRAPALRARRGQIRLSPCLHRRPRPCRGPSRRLGPPRCAHARAEDRRRGRCLRRVWCPGVVRCSCAPETRPCRGWVAPPRLRCEPVVPRPQPAWPDPCPRRPVLTVAAMALMTSGFDGDVSGS